MDAPSSGVHGMNHTHILAAFPCDVAKLAGANRNSPVCALGKFLSNRLEALFDVIKREWDSAAGQTTNSSPEELGALSPRKTKGP